MSKVYTLKYFNTLLDIFHTYGDAVNAAIKRCRSATSSQETTAVTIKHHKGYNQTYVFTEELADRYIIAEWTVK